MKWKKIGVHFTLCKEQVQILWTYNGRYDLGLFMGVNYCPWTSTPKVVSRNSQGVQNWPQDFKIALSLYFPVSMCLRNYKKKPFLHTHSVSNILANRVKSREDLVLVLVKTRGVNFIQYTFHVTLCCHTVFSQYQVQDSWLISEETAVNYYSMYHLCDSQCSSVVGRV